MPAPGSLLPGQLSDDLWAKILVTLKGGVTDGICLRWIEPNSMAKSQSTFHQLRLVCHKFNDLFRTYPRLHRGLMLPPTLTRESLPSLLAWLQQHGASVEIFAAYCGSPCVEAALQKLMPPQTSLDNVFLSQCSSSAVHSMSGLTSLTYCEITSPNDTIDLTPLKDLAKLQKLYLTDGNFTANGLPAHLTNLTMEGANLDNLHNLLVSHSVPLGSSCVTSLRKLRVWDGDILGFHAFGVLACSAVEELQMIKCLIPAVELGQCVSLRDNSSIATCLPVGISTLTLLSSLTLSLGNLHPTVLGTDMVDLGPLHALSLLQDLFVRSEAFGVNLRLPAELSALQNLTSLLLSAPDWAEYDDFDQSDLPVLGLDVEWGGMHALKSLTVDNWHFTCTSSIVALTTLHPLSEVVFGNSRPVDKADRDSSFKHFSLMVYSLARRCPHVKLTIDAELLA